MSRSTGRIASATKSASRGRFKSTSGTLGTSRLMATRITRPLKFLAVSIALLGTACTVSSTDAPGLTGPSELALSFSLAAQPDTITQNGSSQSVITLSAKDVNGKGVPSKVFRLDMLVGRNSPISGAAAQSYGTLSAKTVVTSS